jgi:hypothetical protein
MTRECRARAVESTSIPCAPIPPRSVLLVVAFAAIGIGCGGSSGPPATSPPQSDMQIESKVAHMLQGKWTMFQKADGVATHSNVLLTLRAEGSHLLGKIGADEGEIDGQVQGRTATGSWKEVDGEGTFRWEFSDDATSFKGTFAGMLHSKPIPEGATWTGVRTHD